MKINFLFPEIQHPSDDLSIHELALVLEKKYHILERFCNDTMPYFKERVVKQLNQYGKLKVNQLREDLKNKWRQYIIDNKTGINTKASKERGDPSFIDTSSYYLAMQPEFEFNEKEKKFLL